MSKDWTQVPHAPKWTYRFITPLIKSYKCERCKYECRASSMAVARFKHARDIAESLQAIADAAVARVESGER